jgi:hypothetical protein
MVAGAGGAGRGGDRRQGVAVKTVEMLKLGGLVGLYVALGVVLVMLRRAA